MRLSCVAQGVHEQGKPAGCLGMIQPRQRHGTFEMIRDIQSLGAALGGQEQPLSELAEEYEPYVASGEINSQVADKDAAVAAVVAQFAPAVGEGVGEGQAVHEDFAGVATTVTRMDGTTVAAQDGTWWFNLRPSNTEPFLRYNGEARTAATMEALRDAVLAIVRAER